MNEEREEGGNEKDGMKEKKKEVAVSSSRDKTSLKGDSSLPLPEKIDNEDPIAKILKLITNKQNYFGQQQIVTTSPKQRTRYFIFLRQKKI